MQGGKEINFTTLTADLRSDTNLQLEKLFLAFRFHAIKKEQEGNLRSRLRIMRVLRQISE